MPDSGSATKKSVNVMLVDDSAVVRGLMTRILSGDPDINIIASVSNGEMALSSLRAQNERNQPVDVIILDIEMPIMTGLQALPRILTIDPNVKVVICSTLSKQGATVTLEALDAGAVDFITKPTASQDLNVEGGFASKLIDLVRGLGNLGKAGPRVSPAATTAAPAAVTKPSIAPVMRDTFTLKQDGVYGGRPEIIAIGSSTGGPQALHTVLKNLKGVLNVPLVITQHMPATFTAILADHIEKQSNIPCAEGKDGMPLEPGKIYLAPGGLHMLIAKEDGRARIKISDGPPENFCKPAVDPMLRSVVTAYGQKALCIILTGMGQDGMLGAKQLADIGGRVIGQDKESSVVWGMPGAVAMAGICNKVMPLNDIGPWVKDLITGNAR